MKIQKETMLQIDRTVNIPYSVQQIYCLINDIPAYPCFVPGCIAARVLSHQAQQITALMVIAYAGIEQTLITRNQVILNQSIQLNLVEGPLKQLSGGWYLQPLTSQSCQVRFKLHFELHNGWFDWIIERWVKDLAYGMTDAFVQRARVLYG